MMGVMSDRALLDAYVSAKERVVDAGFGGEIDWQCSRDLGSIEEPDFLAQTAWVILSSGMRESIVRRVFPRVSRAFLDWVSARAIAGASDGCIQAALTAFRHPGKVGAIASAAKRVAGEGFERIQEQLTTGGVEFLGSFDFIGPVTRYHLAKNLGMNVVKPDRHLCRLALSSGRASPQDLCERISGSSGDRVTVVDVVLWRFATLDPSYLELWRSSLRYR